MSEREIRNLSIPEGLNQERVDAALSRLLGLSRNVIVGLIEAGEISRDGKAVGKSDRVITGDQLEVILPAAKGEAKLVATPIDGLKVVYDDEFLIVIDKPVGIAAHPSPGWQRSNSSRSDICSWLPTCYIRGSRASGRCAPIGCWNIWINGGCKK